MINEERMIAAAAELDSCILYGLPEAREHTFSQRFSRKMNRLIFKTDHPMAYMFIKWTSFLMLAVILAGFCFVFHACAKKCDHDFVSDITTDATCVLEGVKTHTCQLCGYAETETIPMMAHSYDAGVQTREATCSAQGVMTYHCTVCAEVKTEPVNVLPHIYGEQTRTKEATCLEEGEITASCTLCGAQKLVEKIEKTDDHTFETHVIRDSTCLDHGHGEERCTLCGYTVAVELDLADHTYGDAVVTKDAGCTVQGERTYTCTVCDHVKTETLPQRGHTWNDVDCETPATCTACGYTQSKARGHNYTVRYDLGSGLNHLGEKYYKCTRCEEDKRVYYGRHGDYDCAAIEKAAINRVKELGFSTDPCIGHGYSKITRELSVAQVEDGGGQAKLEKLMEEMIKELDTRCWVNSQYYVEIEVNFRGNFSSNAEFDLVIYYHECT